LRCGSEAIIKAEFREGVIDGSFELDMKTLVITGKIASGKYEDKLVMVAKEAATKYRIEKTYDKGMLNGQTTIFLDSGKAQFIFQFKLNSLISAGYYENDILKMPLRYQRKPEAGVRKCQISAVEDGRPRQRKSNVLCHCLASRRDRKAEERLVIVSSFRASTLVV
jgi:antitoxin component YwqK of YwqJK toxin-antitoxin module